MWTGTPVNTIDRHVGQRIHSRRQTLGLSLDTLALALGLTPLQAEQIEAGSLHLNAARLYLLSHLLEVSISHFFDGMPAEYAPDFPGSPAAALPPSPGDQTLKRETLDLVRAFFAITDPGLRHQVLRLARQSAGQWA